MNAAAAKPGQPATASAWSWMEQAPLFHAACLFAGGILLSTLVWIPPARLLVGILGLAMLAGLAGWWCRRLAWLPLGLLLCSLGVWSAEMEPQASPAVELLRTSDRLARTVEGTVIGTGPVRDPELAVDSAAGEPASQTVDVRLSSIEIVDDHEDVQQPVAGVVRLTVRWPDVNPWKSLPRFRCGERIRAVARLAPPQVYRDPGVWSRADYLLGQGVTSTGTVDFAVIERLGATGEWIPGCRLAQFQQSSGARLLALPAAMHPLPAFLRLSPEDAVMLTAMITGDRTFLTHSLRLGFERTGSFHMLVVSGLHLAIVSGWVMWAARRLRFSRTPATLITMAAAFFYALFTGFATPVQRSLWMVILYLLGTLIFRERSALNCIGFAALCLLVVHPRSLLESSFQMTLLAVMAIAGVASPLLDTTLYPYSKGLRQLQLTTIDAKIEPRVAQFRVVLRMFAVRLEALFGTIAAWRVFPWFVRVLLGSGELLVVTTIIELMMALPMALYFHRITLFALPVNLLILPLLVVLIPAALVTWLALFFSPILAVVPGAITAAMLHCGLGLVRLFGSHSFGDLRIPAPLAWQGTLFCIFLAVSIFLVRQGGTGMRRAGLAALAGMGVVAVLPRPVQHPRDAILMEAIDVGQGDSTLLITPDGKTLLVDGGGLGGAPRARTPEFDIGEEVVSMALWSRGIRHLDAVALSHAHSDHMDGLPAVLRNFHPQELWVGENPPSTAYRALLAEADELHMTVRAMRSGDHFGFGRTAVAVLAPLRGYHPGAEPANNDSLVLHVAYRATSVLLEGDAEDAVERGMLAESELPSTLLKVGHHGGASSTQAEFLERVSPQWAVISCGYQNRYGQPRPEVLARLESERVRTFSTDTHGATCFELDGRSVKAVPWCTE